MSAGNPFIWSLPFFCHDVDSLQLSFDSTKVHTASRVEDHVPISSEEFQGNVTFALPAEGADRVEAPEEAPAPEAPPARDDRASDAHSGQADEDPLPT